MIEWTVGIVPCGEEWKTSYVISQACWLRQLHHLFWYDIVMQKMVMDGVEGVDEERKVLLEHLLMHGLVVG